jgi:ergothioneine biosynthesis protein EgtC
MCRFVLYQGPPMSLASLVTEPSHSIINQSVHCDESEEPLNGDGFGLAWYAPEASAEPAVFRSVTPAWNNMNLLDLARVTKSECVLAHVRAATRGLPVTELNCHPFKHGHHAFMHNGDVARFQKIRRRLLLQLSDEAFRTIRGSTDSEHVFAVFLDQLAKRTETDKCEAMAAALLAAVARVVTLSREVAGAEDEQEESYLNIAISDGLRSVACRFTTSGQPSSLYLHTGRKYVCDGGVCRMLAPERGKGAVLISSEPLSDDPGWQRIPPNHMAVVREDRTVDLRSMHLSGTEGDQELRAAESVENTALGSPE